MNKYNRLFLIYSIILCFLIGVSSYLNVQKDIKMERLQVEINSKTTSILNYETKIENLEYINKDLQCQISNYKIQNNELLDIIISYEVIEVKPYIVYGDNNFKAYMPYTAVTDTSSNQYALLNNKYANTNKTNGLRMSNDRYCIAIGSGWGANVGTYVDLVLDNGTIINCVVGDMKDNIHTDDTNKVCLSNGSIAEFIVDYSIFHNFEDGSGTVNYVENFNSKIVQIVIF